MKWPLKAGGPTGAVRSGKIVVIAIVGLGLTAALAKIGHEYWVFGKVKECIARLREDLASRDPVPLLAGGHLGLREHLKSLKEYPFLLQYRDRVVPLLEEAYRRDREPAAAVTRAAWLLILLRLDHPRSRAFFEEVLPGIQEPDLRKDVEEWLARHAAPPR